MKERILFESDELIVVNKMGGEPAVKDLTEDVSLLEKIQEQLNISVYPLHRIDRPVSGAVMFAKSKEAAAFYSSEFKERRVQKVYLAATADKPSSQSGKINGWLKSSGKKNKAYFSETPEKNGKKASALYSVVDQIDNYFLLALQLETGRHHQLRAQLSYINCPAKGDVKYGARRKNTDRSIHLHAYLLAFKHKSSATTEKIIAPPPDDGVWNAFDLNKVASAIDEGNNLII